MCLGNRSLLKSQHETRQVVTTDLQVTDVVNDSVDRLDLAKKPAQQVDAMAFVEQCASAFLLLGHVKSPIVFTGLPVW